MNQMDRWIEQRMKMKNAGKTLIVSVLVVEALLGIYFVVEREKDDSPATATDTVMEDGLRGHALKPEATGTGDRTGKLSAASHAGLVATVPALAANQKPAADNANQSVMNALPGAAVIGSTKTPTTAGVDKANPPVRRVVPHAKAHVTKTKQIKAQAKVHSRHQRAATEPHSKKLKASRTHQGRAATDSRIYQHSTAPPPSGSNAVDAAMTDQLVKQSVAIVPAQASGQHRNSGASGSATDQRAGESNNVYVTGPPTLRGRK